MMDRQAAPRHIRRRRTVIHGDDEIALIEIHLEGQTGEIPGGELKRRLGKIDAVIVPDPRFRQHTLHQARIAAGNIEHREGVLANLPLSAAPRRSPTALCDSQSVSTSF